MIKNHGADAVRWFILSDSPPEKDIQWSEIGVSSAHKFLQKIWNLNFMVINFKNSKVDEEAEIKFISEMNNFIYKIDNSIKKFRFNVCVANFYEIYNFLKTVLKKVLVKKF